jgi:hypothetical protein
MIYTAESAPELSLECASGSNFSRRLNCFTLVNAYISESISVITFGVSMHRITTIHVIRRILFNCAGSYRYKFSPAQPCSYDQ